MPFGGDVYLLVTYAVGGSGHENISTVLLSEEQLAVDGERSIRFKYL